MRRLSLPQPPDPANATYSTQLAYNRAIHDWCVRVKGLIEDGWRINSAPCGQQMLATSFTTSTIAEGTNAVVAIPVTGVATGTATVTATATITDVASANVLASLIQALTDKGILSPTVSRSATQ